MIIEFEGHGKEPKDLRRSDQRIFEDVCEELARNPDINATEIEVKVHEGFVSLQGFVDARDEKWTAEFAIESIPGVKDVDNKIKLRKNPASSVEASISGQGNLIIKTSK